MLDSVARHAPPDHPHDRQRGAIRGGRARESHVTFTRDNNLFIVPLDGGEHRRQLTDVAAAASAIRADRQPEVPEGGRAEADRAHAHEAEKKKKAEEKDKATRCRSSSSPSARRSPICSCRPTARTSSCSSSSAPRRRKRPNVPNYVTEIELHRGHSRPDRTSATRRTAAARGAEPRDRQDRLGRRQLRAAGRRAGNAESADRRQDAGARRPAGTKAQREVRWSMPPLSDDGAIAVAQRARRPTTRIAGSWPSIPNRARRGCSTPARRCVGARGGRVRAGRSVVRLAARQQRLWFLSERDGWMHLYTRRRRPPAHRRRGSSRRASGRSTSVELSPDRKKFYITTTEVHPGERHLYSMPVDGGARTKLTSMTGANDGEVSPDDTTIGLVYSYSTKPPEVYLMPNRPGADGDAGDDDADRGMAVVQVGRAAARSPTRRATASTCYARLYTPEMVGARRDPSAPAVVFVHGAGYLQNAHKYWSTLLPRVHVPQPAGVARLRRARSRLPRQRRLRPRLADGDLPPHGRQGSRGRRRRREVPGRQAEGERRSASASTAAATAGSSR